MRTIQVSPVPGGWSVDSRVSGWSPLFLSEAAAEQAAYKLAQALATDGGLAQVLVRDASGVVTASTVMGPPRSKKTRNHRR